MPPEPHPFDFIGLIDHSISEPLFQRWLEYCEERPVAGERLEEYGGGYELQFFHTGVSMLVDVSEAVKIIHIFTRAEQGYSPYQHELPFGATARTTRAEVPELFCEPTASGGPVQNLPCDAVTYWDRWEFDNFVVHFEYPEDCSSICRATVMSPSLLPEPGPEESEVLDPKAIYFSLPTINDTLPTTQTAAPQERDFLIQEDDWRQFEAVSRDVTTELDRELESILRIYREKSELSGRQRLFTEMHIRKLISRPLQDAIRWTELLEATEVPAREVAGLGFQGGQSVIRGGFSFSVDGLTLFGVHHGEMLEALCLDTSRWFELGKERAERIAGFLEKKNLVLVYWPNAAVRGGQNTIAEYLQGKDQE